ncbi:hypothetical protein T4B_14061 [Trichinella pseudospiralis]|uniref:Uncharacterized protein n=1 Tax=Trichinella pseudospiralis TaxID=6337 RepID=A0A0V1JAQ2_TRIPS|nr:hypothetical protein T4B_14061 [Trichinella pseudospiralis]
MGFCFPPSAFRLHHRRQHDANLGLLFGENFHFLHPNYSALLQKLLDTQSPCWAGYALAQ